MKEIGIIPLEKHYFTSREKIIFELGNLTASIFTYDTGVRALKLENRMGYLIGLPFKGQQIWELHFNERQLGMKSMFKQPKNVDFFLNTYGCFFMHCGAWRMGCPGPEDNHPLHGELPLAPYDSAGIIFGEDENGRFIGMTGSYNYSLAFSVHYTAIPTVKLYEDMTLVEISIHIQNRSGYPMELMYMAHVNFRPVTNGKILQTLKWDSNHMVLRKSVPAHIKVSDKFKDLLNRLEVDPGISKILREEDEYNPEVAFFMTNPDTDKEGWAHFLQVHPDGSSDYIKYKPAEFDHATRWITRTKDQEALGLALPATCDPEGYTAEQKKGNIKLIEAGGKKSFTLFAGYLSKKDTEKVIEKLGDILV